METLLLIDGHNLFFQMYFGLPKRITDKNGAPVQGVVGFVGALKKLIALTNATRVLAVFDSESSLTKRNAYVGYKANREEFTDDDNPFCQLPLVYDALDLLGVKRYEAADVEADDVIASYALKYGGRANVFISSYDSDYFQLLTPFVKVIRYRGKGSVVCDEQYLANRFGITPDLYASFKALTGDAADNIRGIDGIGVKTAAKIVNACGNVDNIINNIAAIDAKLREKIQSNAQTILTNYSMIKLDDADGVPFDIDELTLPDRGFSTAETLKRLNIW